MCEIQPDQLFLSTPSIRNGQVQAYKSLEEKKGHVIPIEA